MLTVRGGEGVWDAVGVDSVSFSMTHGERVETIAYSP
jgi:hypothetical protein